MTHRLPDRPTQSEGVKDDNSHYNYIDPLEAERELSESAPRDTTQPYIYTEEPPQFPGDIRRWLMDNMRYPSNAGDTEGRVVVRFVIEEDGSTSEVRVVRSVSAPLDAEAVRLVRSMPCWKPGRQGGRAVRCVFALPIRVCSLD